MANTQTESGTVWCLTGRLDEKSTIKVFRITGTPFSIGRQFGMGLTIPSKLVSGHHADITEEDNELWICDQESTNGTYVNGKPAGKRHQLKEGDLLQFADVAFRVGRVSTPGNCQTQDGLDHIHDQAVALVQLERLLKERAVVPHFQPVVVLPEINPVGYEALARSRLFGLQTPADMFLAASQLNQEEELSRVLRLVALETGSGFPDAIVLHLNTHATEIVTYDLLASLRILREMEPHRPLVLEVTESCAKDTSSMRLLRDALTSLNMQLALEDVGEGKTRLLDLVKISPDFIKFDMHLIRGVHTAPSDQRRRLTYLVRSVLERGIVPVVEGVEREEEHHMCCEVGFKLAQGFFYGKPERLKVILARREDTPDAVGHVS